MNGISLGRAAAKAACLCRRLLGVCLSYGASALLLGSSPLIAQVAPLHFTNGNGTASVDQYAGASGGGWAGAWLTQTGANLSGSTVTVLGTTPTHAGGGNYLSVKYNVNGTGGTTANQFIQVYRQLNSANLDLSSAVCYEFTLRPDATVSNANQALVLFSGASTSSFSWKITADGGGWNVYNGTTAVALGKVGATNLSGTTYRFWIVSDPATNTWSAIIDNLTNVQTVASGTLAWRTAGSSESTYLNFLSQSASTVALSNLGFSLDALSVSAPPESTRYGVNAGPWRTSGHIAECDQIIASGVKWVRMIPNWSSIETAQGVYNTTYLTALDESINRFVSRDVKVILSIGMTPQWASTLPTSPWPTYAKVRPSNWAYWENFITFLANRYNNKVYYWEVWNEPDYDAFWTGTVAEYAELVTRASPIIRTANANNKVLMGALAMQSTSTTESYGLGTFFDQLFAVSGVSAAVDIVNYHAYGKMSRHILMHQGMQDVIAKYSIQAKPLWITETGYSQTAASSDFEALKADYVDQAWFLYEGWGDVDRVFYHHYRNITGGNFSENNFAFTTSTLSPLKALYHFGGLGGAQADPQLQLTYPTQTDFTLPLLYNSTGSSVKAGQSIPSGYYGYYRVDDTWAYNVNQAYYADITYLDQGSGNFAVQFDAAGGAYTSVTLARAGTNTGNWLTATATLNNAKFANGQSNFADLRVESMGSELFVKSVVIRRASDNAAVTVTHVAPPAGNGSRVMAQSRIASNGYMYFKVNDTWMANNQNGVDDTVYVDVLYQDVGSGNFALEYDSTAGAYTSLLKARTGTGNWLSTTFTLSGARFANSQNGSSDLRLYSGGAELNVKSVVLYRSLNPGSARFKATSEFKLMRPRTDTNSANVGYTIPTTMGGIECHQIASNGKYLHAEVSSALVRPDQTNVTIAITFWDSGTDGLVLEWCSTAGAGVSGLSIFKTNTNAWKTVSVPVTDAKFDHHLSYSGDVRINNRSDGSVEYISRIDVNPN